MATGIIPTRSTTVFKINYAGCDVTDDAGFDTTYDVGYDTVDDAGR